MKDKLKITRPVIVEGKYDKIKLSSILDAAIITTDGFGIFKEKEKLALIRKLAERGGVIVLTDSDGAGFVIRNYINSAVNRSLITHLYTPSVKGKERRKTAVSKEGLLGVEGMEAEYLRELFRPYAVETADDNVEPDRRRVTKTDFYTDGLSGGEGSAVRRETLARRLDLPRGMSANALLEAVNLLCTYEQYKGFVANI